VTAFGSTSGAWDAAIQPDRKIVAAGYGRSSAKRTAFAVARYRSDGSLDAGFGNGGKVTTDFYSP
jgi:hypothetical protein